ncbi:DNA topoisomerase [Stenotrophomonas maltophilia]|uniref:DNA topoisomerase n=1 Tax=Stenotrophomonas maltophilia TaxID=40324 RepID=UPI000F6668F5|nr:DNA topoisomerase [Stenotrophomonas maltophilia]RRU72149.1 hypothetical protein EGJ89_10075 [Stenotrophomonas maltophilia]
MSAKVYCYIAEKPAVGKAIAEVLAKRSPIVERGQSFIRGVDWSVGMARGHLYELMPPEHYISQRFPDVKPDAKGRIPWSRDHLPLLISPGDFAVRCTDKTAIASIRKLLRDCDVVVHAGDCDREGQLVVDTILKELRNTKPVKRYWSSGTDEVLVTRALNDLRDNRDYVSLSQAALARSFADWIVGMNLSRWLTLRAQGCGTRGTLNYGRVASAVLGLIVQREKEITDFVPVDYLSPKAKIQVAAGQFVAEWQPREGHKGLDAAGRLVDPAVARELQAKVAHRQAKITRYVDEEKLQGPPLPFSLAQLQMFAAKKFGYSLDSTLRAVQSLYDSKFVSYPRTGSSHLSPSMREFAPQTLEHVTKSLGLSGPILAEMDHNRTSAAWNEAKTKAHHAIIPLTKKPDLASLGAVERNVYIEICRRFAAQFLPPRKYRAVEVEATVEGEVFRATGSTTVRPGWKALYGSELDSAQDKSPTLPQMSGGDEGQCLGLELVQKRTEPPARFTDSSLLDAMLNVHKFVTDQRVVEIFKRMRASASSDADVGGLGTPATRHTFAAKLIETGFIRGEKGKGKELVYHPEPVALPLMAALPEDMGKPNTTALWETVFESIEKGEATLEQFMQVQHAWIKRKFAEIDCADLALPAIVRPGPAAGASRRPASGGYPQRRRVGA